MRNTLSTKDYPQKMKKLAKKMAAYFHYHFSDKEIVIWHLEAIEVVIQFCERKKSFESDSMDFLLSFRYVLFEACLSANSSKQRLVALEDNLPWLFDSICSLKAAIVEIGKAYLASFEKVSNDQAGVHSNFMKHLSSFMELADIYRNYEYYQDQLSKEEELKSKPAA